MTTMFQDKVKCAVCGKESDHSFVKGSKAFGELDLDTNPDKIEPSTLPYLIQRCPNCGYCSTDLSELMKGADEQIDSEEYRTQLSNKKFPELANSFLCTGLLYKIAEEYDKAGWDCLHAAKVCDDKENKEASVYCRKRTYSMFVEAMDSGQKFMDDASKERQILDEIARKAGLFETVEKPKLNLKMRRTTMKTLKHYFTPARSVLLLMGLAALLTSAQAAVQIEVDPGAYTGHWFVSGQTGTLSGQNTVTLASPGNFFIVIGAGGSIGNFTINVATDGTVTVPNGVSAIGGQNVVTFNTAPLTVDPAAYTGSWYIRNGISPTFSGTQTVTVVPAVAYRIKIGAPGSIGAFDLQFAANETVTVSNGVSGFGGQNSVTFETTTINIDPGGFGGSWRFANSIAGPLSGPSVLKLVPSVRYRFVISQNNAYQDISIGAPCAVDPSLFMLEGFNFIIDCGAPPVADAGLDQTVLIGESVQLDGSGSGDPDGDPMTYDWSIVSKPAGSAAALSDPSVVDPTFQPDEAGEYVVQLVVNDATVDSDPDNVTVTAQTPQQATHDVIAQVAGLVASGALNRGQGNSLISKLDGAIAKLDQGNTNAAINKRQAFINQVNAFINGGNLTLDEGQPLIDAVNEVIDNLNGWNGKRMVTEDVKLPDSYTLYNNYPNPFNPITTLQYDLPENNFVRITIYDLMGREVRTLINKNQDAGFKSVIWNATNNQGKPVSAGVCLYQIRARAFVQTNKMVLLK